MEKKIGKTETDERISAIRKSEELSHIQMYSEHDLFSGDSWLSHPVKTIMELLQNFKDYQSIRVLDLGCGIGRNSIPIAKTFLHIPCIVDCVDILPFAINRLKENAIRYSVSDRIFGHLSSIEDYCLQQDCYDLILSVSAIEHMESVSSFYTKLCEINESVRADGIVCFIVSCDISETDLLTGDSLLPQFELNFSTEHLRKLLDDTFTDFCLLKTSICPQQYEIPRDKKMVLLRSNVLTYVTQKKRSDT